MSVLASMGFMVCGCLASKNGYDHRFNGKLTRKNGDIVFVSGNILTGNPDFDMCPYLFISDAYPGLSHSATAR